MASRESGQSGDQPQRGEAWCRGDDDLAPTGLRADPGNPVANALQTLLAGGLQHQAFVGECQRAMPAQKQWHPEVVLECANLPADGRLGDEAFVGGPGETQMAGCDLERGQGLEGRQAGVVLHELQACQSFGMIV